MRKSDLLMEYLKLYGSHSIAYSAVADTKLHSFYLDEAGFIIYGSSNQYRFILGDPICDSCNSEKIIKAFILDCEKYKHTLNALQISLDTAKIFHSLGYNANHMGVDTILFLDTFNIQGKAKNKVRRWINAATKANVEVKEESFDDKALLKEVKALSDRWLQGKANQQELSLLTRPFVLEQEPYTRLFCGYVDGKLVGFNVFEPIFKQNDTIGYYANINRVDDNAPNGTLDLIQQIAREAFKEEGCKYFSFGLSPMTDFDDCYGMHNSIISSLFKTSYKYGNKLYSFKGLDFHKKAYHDGKSSSSERVPMFMITKGSMPLYQGIEMLSYIGIVPNKSFISKLAYLGDSIAGEVIEQAEEIKNKEKEKAGMPEITSKLMHGIGVEDVAKSLKYSIGLIGEISEALSTSIEQALDNLNSSHAKVYFEKELPPATAFISTEIIDICDDDSDVVFVHDIALIKYGKGYYAVLTIELRSTTTVAELDVITQRLKSLIVEKFSDVLCAVIEVEPAGAFAKHILQVGLGNTSESDLA